MSPCARLGVSSAIVCIFTAGCLSSRLSMEEVLEQRMAVLQQLEDDGHLDEARYQWTALRNLAPEHEEIGAAVARIGERINARKAELQKQLDQAEAKQDWNAAQRVHLRFLALDPANDRSFSAARGIEQQKMDQALTVKTHVFNQSVKRKGDQKASMASPDKVDRYAQAAEIAGYIDAMQQHYAEAEYLNVLMMGEAFLGKHNPQLEVARLLLAAYVALGEEQQSRGNLEAALAYYEKAGAIDNGENTGLADRRSGVQKALSEQYLEEGMRYFRNDIQKARALFEASLSFDPDNHRARRELGRAALIEKNLRRINSGK